MENNKEKKNNGKKIIRLILFILAIILIVAGAIMMGMRLYDQYNANKDGDNLASIASTTEQETEAKAENPIDFESLKVQNNEIFGWIKVPGTKVDYPLCKSKKADDFYLKHSAYDKSYLSSGAIYVQSMNSKKLDDRVTVIYGHNGYGDTMFTTLHKFEKQDFFDKHEYFYIYTPDTKKTYQIVSAFKYDDRHIMNSFDFHNNDIFQEFIDMIQNPTSSNKKVRDSLDKQITIDDNIVVLSTCITNQKSSRYLVCGVLVQDEKTN